MLQDETSHEQERQRGLGVRNHATSDQLKGLRQGLGGHLDELVRLACVLVRDEIRRPEQVNFLVREAGRRPYSSKTLESAGFHTHLLQQLSLRTDARVFAGVQPPRGNLDER